jgi:hypothetical protein
MGKLVLILYFILIMNIYVTEIKAIDPQTGELCDWCGPHIEAKSIEDARRFCDNNGMGYCKIIGKLLDEISTINTEICQN